MGNRIEVKSDKTRALEEVEGSDGRLNVSSRSDSRGYYISRDEGDAYSMIFTHTSTEAGEYVASLSNTSTTGKTLVISAVGVNTVLVSTVRAHFVTGTAAGGTAVTPTNLNRTSNNDAAATGHEGGAAASGITGLTAVANTDKIDRVQCPAGGHEQLRFDDRVRLGQGDGFALEVETVASASNTFGVIFFYFE